MVSVLFILLGFSILFTIVFYTSWFKKLSNWAKGAVLIFKMMASLTMIYTYTELYPTRSEADIFKYFDDSKKLSSIAFDSPGQYIRILTGQWDEKDLPVLNEMNYWFRSYDHGIANDNRIIIKINALLNLFNQGVYELNLCFFLLLSLFGSYFLYSVFESYSSPRWVCFCSAFLVPSTLFWSSGILKESLLLFALGGFIYAFNRVFYRHRKSAIFLLLFSLGLLMQLKVYILFALAPILAFGLLRDLLKSSWKAVVITSFIVGICLSLQAFFVPNWNLFSIIQGKQFDFIQMSKAVHAGSQVEIIPLDGHAWTFMKSAMLGFFNVIFYPHILVIKPWYGVVFAIENTVMFMLMLGVIYSLNNKKHQIEWPVLWLIFGLLVFVIIGITVPVVGAIIRYKSPVLPFLFFGLYRMQGDQVKHFLESNKLIKWLNTHL